MKRKHKKEQGILKVTFIPSDLSEEEKERRLFEVFDLLLYGTPKKEEQQ